MTSKIDVNWNLNFQKLIEFYENHKMIPNKYQDEDLAKWIFTQKYNKKLKPERIEKLNSLPFWKWPKPMNKTEKQNDVQKDYKNESVILIDDDVEFIEIRQKNKKKIEIVIDDDGDIIIPKLSKNNIRVRENQINKFKKHDLAKYFYPEKRSFLKNNFIKIIEDFSIYSPIPPPKHEEDNIFSPDSPRYTPTNISKFIPLNISIYDKPANSQYINKIYKIYN